MRIVSDDAWGYMTVWQEARGEPFDGKVGVSEVIQRRARNRFMSDGSIAGTVLRPYQFSGWNTKDPNRIPVAKLTDNDLIVMDCIRAWEVAKGGSNLTGDAMHYYNKRLANPRWARGAVVTAEIGNHTFVIPKHGG